MTKELELFVEYLTIEKQASHNTVISYERDLNKMVDYLQANGCSELSQVTQIRLTSYVLELEKEGMKASTISRNIAAMKAFFHFCERRKLKDDDPAEDLKAPKIEKKEAAVLSADELDRLFEQIDGTSPKELRDKSMLSLLCATGMKVEELMQLKLEDVNMQMEYVVCRDSHREKVLPFDRATKKAMERYLTYARPAFVTDNTCPWLFTNRSGKRMSRQGFWKLIKYYGEQAGIQTEITPYTLRHSSQQYRK